MTQYAVTGILKLFPRLITEQPRGIDCSWSDAYQVDSAEDTYLRNFKVPLEPTLFPQGWILNPSFVVIRNTTGEKNIPPEMSRDPNILRHAFSGHRIFYGPMEKPDAFCIPALGRPALLCWNGPFYWFAEQEGVTAEVCIAQAEDIVDG